MNKKPVVLVFLLAAIFILAYAGFIASMPAAPNQSATGQVKLEVKGAPSVSTATGMVELVVVNK
ncbi:MAG: hypothetical protein QXD77_02230 [Candidatus Aenigmatarchaeota archaeon]